MHVLDLLTFSLSFIGVRWLAHLEYGFCQWCWFSPQFFAASGLWIFHDLSL